MLNILSLNIPHKLINAIKIVLVGKKIHEIAPTTKNGPNGIYSSLLFNIKFLIIKTKIDIIAPTKNANSEICATELTPKYNPTAPINFTSP